MHPESHVARSLEHEDHPRTGIKMLSKHQADFPFGISISDFDLHVCPCLAVGRHNRDAWTASASEQRDKDDEER
jgi:hypothetical protein